MRRALLLLAALPVLGGGVAEGNRLYRAGQFRRAAEVYARRYAQGDSSVALRYDLGTALLRLQRWDEARPHLEAAVEAPRQPELRQRALYNAGNADLEPVFRRKVTDQARRTEMLRRAIGRYKDALLARPNDADAKWNLELALRLLRNQPPSGGGGGGQDQDQGGGQGGDAQPRNPAPNPSPAPNPAPAPELTQEQAERILTGASREEADAQRQVLSRNRSPRNAVRDW
ncbi:MAG TPA: tetratricopeptide repeat protein [Longimicrobium sp.]|nr:tetratricopeptide repeat protein [Longimicrobium sp.]